jgi:hypothetical protein
MERWRLCLMQEVQASISLLRWLNACKQA